MERIKLRVINPDTKEIVAYEEFIENAGWQHQDLMENGEHHNWEKGISIFIGFPREMYAGRKDRNKTEIYECDIIKRLGGTEPKFEVVFDLKRGGFAYKQGGGDVLRFLFDYTQDEIEVIGNTHKNPELLKK